MLLCIDYKDLIFCFFIIKAYFDFNKKEIKELVSKKVVKFIYKLIIIILLYKIVF